MVNIKYQKLQRGSPKGNLFAFASTKAKRMLIGAICLFAAVPCVIMVGDLMQRGKGSVIQLNDTHIAEWTAEDPRLIEHIRKYYLTQPASADVPYNLKNPTFKYWSQKTQSKAVEDILESKRNGFFIECGAYDGETYSNTLSFEKYLGWTGILIEPERENLKLLKSKNRRAWIVEGCLGDSDRPQKLTLYAGGFVSILDKHMNFIRNVLTRVWQPLNKYDVWCFPMMSILMAVNKTTKIDYFSLDVERAEMDILRGIPWNKVDVDVLQVECVAFQGIYYEKDGTLKQREIFRSFMKQTLPNYKELALVVDDVIYRKSTDKN